VLEHLQWCSVCDLQKYFFTFKFIRGGGRIFFHIFPWFPLCSLQIPNGFPPSLLVIYFFTTPSHSSLLVMYFFTTPPIKLKLGQQINGWESTNRKPPGPIITISQSEILSRSQIIFILQSFPKVCSAFLPGTANYANMLSQKPLSWDTPVCSLGSQWVFHDVLQVPNVLFLQGVPNCTSLYYCMHILCPKFSPSLLTYEPRGGEAWILIAVIFEEPPKFHFPFW